MIVWKEIPGYGKGYLISNDGQVKTMKRKSGSLMKFRVVHGHLSIALCHEGKYKMLFVHRLVAMTFLENKNNLPLVNHKNGNKKDNRVENLEWCTHSYNTRHGRSPEGVILYPRDSRVASVMIPMVKQLVPLR